jgi:hypothetical protein
MVVVDGSHRYSKRSPDEQSDIRDFYGALKPRISLRTCGLLAYAASTARLTACGSAIERKNAFG